MKQEKDSSIIAPVCYIITAGLLLYLVVSGYNYLTSSSDDTRDPIDPNVTETNINTTGNQPPEDDLKKEPHEADPQNFAKDRDDKRLIMVSSIKESCGKPWKAGRKEIKEATIKKVEYIPQPETGLNELHLDVKTADHQNFIIPSIKESCGKPWKAGRKEIKEATIKKVEYIPQPETGLNELHLDVKTADHQNFIIHVSPEYKISRCPDLFDFQEGETVTVVGYELSGNQGNICATELTRQHADTLRLRDRTTGKYNNKLFKHEICRKELEPTQEACWHSWKTPLMEIEGTIRKVEYKTPPLGNFAGLHLDIKTYDQQDILVHVFPEPKTSQCPDLFRFQPGEEVTVIGSQFSTPNKQGNICAAEIIRQDGVLSEFNEQDAETLKLKVLKLRDSITGNHNNTVFNNKICIDEDELKRSCLFNWVENFLGTGVVICKACTDEIMAWNNSTGLLEVTVHSPLANFDHFESNHLILPSVNQNAGGACEWLQCADKIEWIPKVYSGDCTLCQEILCSKRCPDSKLPLRCWRNCMKNCGRNIGRNKGYMVDILLGLKGHPPGEPFLRKEVIHTIVNNAVRKFQESHGEDRPSFATGQSEVLFPTSQTPTPPPPDQSAQYPPH